MCVLLCAESVVMSVIRFFSASIFVLMVSHACTTTPESPPGADELEKPGVQEEESQETAQPEVSPTGVAECLAFSALVEGVPHFFADVGVVVTDVQKPCETLDGRAGYMPGSGWVAMGFPCSGGGGRIDWRGSVHRPNLVIFQAPNSCPMSPDDMNMAASLVKPRLGMGEGSNLLAYYPFAIAFWELADGSDADTGSRIEVVTTGPRQRKWTSFQAGQPIEVRLYGRPNSLVPSRDWYEVKAHLLRDGDHIFKIEVKDVKVLNDQELEQVKQRCFALTPARNCRQAF